MVETSAFASLLLLLPLMVGCTARSHSAAVEGLRSNCSPIVGGQLDAGHRSVVALLGEGGNLVFSGSLIGDYARDADGPCSGDSGGPALVDVDGRSVVLGITSSGDETCRVNGTSARVSAGLDFVTAVLGGESPPLDCGDG